VHSDRGVVALIAAILVLLVTAIVWVTLAATRFLD
jgi:hypothetical protein